MDKMKAIDLFCGAGGASVGIASVGYEMLGVDTHPQPHYLFEFVQDDALTYPLDGFDFIWASPPCQKFTAYKRRPNYVGKYPDLIEATRKRLMASKAKWCIENVPGAPLINPTCLCGSSFGLDVRRHRHFETNFEVEALPCDHSWQTPRFPPATNRKNLRRTVEVGVWRIPLSIQQRAMEIRWMNLKELSQAIPPAYAAYIAKFAIRK